MQRDSGFSAVHLVSREIECKLNQVIRSGTFTIATMSLAPAGFEEANATTDTIDTHAGLRRKI